MNLMDGRIDGQNFEDELNIDQRYSIHFDRTEPKKRPSIEFNMTINSLDKGKIEDIGSDDGWNINEEPLSPKYRCNRSIFSSRIFHSPRGTCLQESVHS